MYDINKYDYVEHVNQTSGATEVIAISSFGGKTVKGVAKCDSRDIEHYNFEQGKALAAARCNVKVCDKRVKRAEAKVAEAQAIVEQAALHYANMVRYHNDAVAEQKEAYNHLKTVSEKM